MKMHFRKNPSIKIALSALAVAVFTSMSANATQMSWVKGGNWADDGDNYQSGVIIPAGLSYGCTTAQAQSKADQIASNLSYVGANMVRLGINPACTSDSYWWGIMQAYINELVAKGFYVTIACWDGPDKDGIINNWSDFVAMWQTIDSVYNANWNIWYTPFNEPHGYSASSLLNNVYYPFCYTMNIKKSQQRIILAGTGYDDHLASVGADSRFTTCKLSQHIYPYWGSGSESYWQSFLNGRIAGYQDRAVITEMGAPATTGLNYRATSSDNNVCFIRGVLQEAHNLGIGVIYWPSHRDGDSYRLFVDTVGGQWTNWSLMTELQSL